MVAAGTQFIMQDTARNDATRPGEVFCLMSGVVNKYKYRTPESIAKAEAEREKRQKEIRKKEMARQKKNVKRGRRGEASIPALASDSDMDDISEYIEEDTQNPVVKEIMVFRDPPVIHVHDVIHNARRAYRTLVYTSETTFSLRCLGHGRVRDATKENKSRKASQERDTGARDRFREADGDGGRSGFSNSRRNLSAGRLCGGGMEAGEPNEPPLEPSTLPSLAIERILTAELGRERFLPARFLYGIVPDALLNAYSFWRNKEGPFITGYPILSKLDTAQTVCVVLV